MKILYFSGTGNSFYVAKRIAEKHPHTVIVSIPAFSKRKEQILENDEIVIIAPIYFYGIPHIVTNFLKHTEFRNVTYFSVIFTAEFPNGIAMNMLKDICNKKRLVINSCFYIKMPTNYVIKSKMLMPSEIESTLAKADEKIEKIIRCIQNKKNVQERDSLFYSIIVGAKKSYITWEQRFTEFDSEFMCTDACTSCKICERNCPVGNITVEKNPSWKGQCEACLKCINICPQTAIQYNGDTEGRERYFNPRIRVQELI